MARTATYFDLRDAFGEEGCAVCRLTLAAVDRYIESTNYDTVNDPGFRAVIEPAQGFCNQHAAQWLREAHHLGTALIYETVLGQVADELARLRPIERSRFLTNVATFLGYRNGANERPEPCDALRIEGSCPACRIRIEEEAMAISTLIEGLDEDAFRKAYERSSGLCLPHLRQAICMGAIDPAFSVLRAVALATHERLRGQLREVARKHDYRFRMEPFGEEYGAVERAVRHVAAAPGIDHR